jgi:hypothetical protein
MLKHRVGLIIIFILIYIMATWEGDVFYVLVMLNMIMVISLWMSLEDFRTYKEQTYLVRTWLQCLVIGSVGAFITLLIFILGIIIGTYQL